MIALAGGLVALLFGANWLVDGASALAARLQVSPMVIGLTVVAFGTSTPELAINLSASAAGNPGLALGNVLGSNIANILLILGVSACAAPLAVRSATQWAEIPFGVLAVAAAAVAAADGLFDGAVADTISRADGASLLLFFLVFIAYVLRTARSDGETGPELKPASPWRSGALVIAGLALLVGGGHFLVEGATGIALALGVSERVIGLTIVAIGTSAPELAASVVAARKGHPEIALGNVVGSNIINVFLVLGASALVNPLPVPAAAWPDLLVALGASLLLFIATFTVRHRVIVRGEGVLFLVLYAGYLAWLLAART